MKEGTPNIGAVCQRLAKHAPSGLSAEQIAYRLGRPYNTLMSEAFAPAGTRTSST